ncbi:penicillin-binding protein 1A [Desulfomarina sp.]
MVTKKKKTDRRPPTRKTRIRKKVYNEKHIFSFFLVVCFFQTLFLGGLLYILVSLHIPDIRNVANYQPSQATLIYDRYGRVVDRMFVENRTVIPLSAMSPYLPKAFVAAEDGRFFEHSGLDIVSVFRAAVNNFRKGGRGQGGSTITQQVAKSLLLTPEKTYVRKFKEAVLAWRIDRLLSKEEILYIYLNQIYLGEGAFGVEAAARTYFDKPASQLTLGECALLAGLPQAPSRYSLFSHLQRAVKRQRYVLNRMAADGYVSAGAARNAYLAPVHLRKRRHVISSADKYYLQVVKKRARAVLRMPLQQAGAHIYTNLDSRMEDKAAKALKRGVRNSLKRQKKSGRKGAVPPQGALVVIETASGRVRAVVGGIDFTRSPFDRATQARRPAGSTFKPFVYATALQKGWAPDSVIDDSPVSIRGRNGKLWRPGNYSGKYHGRVTLRTALAYSYNAAAVRLLQKTGVKSVLAFAEKAGITSAMPADLSLALGAGDVSLLEMTAAYTVFAGNGTSSPPVFIDKIVMTDGQVRRFSDGRHRRKVMSARELHQMQSMLAEVIRSGTGRRVGSVPGARGGKTGTSNDYRDAWFIGYDGKLTSGVWLGNDHNRSLGRGESGGTAAAPVWRDFMLSLKQDK